MHGNGRVARYQNISVTGHLLINNRGGRSVKNALLDLEDIFASGIKLPRGTWLSIGVRYSTRKRKDDEWMDQSLSPRNKGWEARAYWQRAERRAFNFLTARTIDARMRKRRRRRAEEIIVRVYWHGAKGGKPPWK